MGRLCSGVTRSLHRLLLVLFCNWQGLNIISKVMLCFCRAANMGTVTFWPLRLLCSYPCAHLLACPWVWASLRFFGRQSEPNSWMVAQACQELMWCMRKTRFSIPRLLKLVHSCLHGCFPCYRRHTLRLSQLLSVVPMLDLLVRLPHP
jgi:hypothetical protein